MKLGSGAVADGSGPGSYASLSGVFRDFEPVYMEVSVGGEALSPRTRVVSAAYAFNADHLDGKDSTELLDTSATPQSKAGDLSFGGNVTVSGLIEIQGGDPAPGRVLTAGVNGLAGWQDPLPGPPGPEGPQGPQGLQGTLSLGSLLKQLEDRGHVKPLPVQPGILCTIQPDIASFCSTGCNECPWTSRGLLTWSAH